jgi:hypothetical protein
MLHLDLESADLLLEFMAERVGEHEPKQRSFNRARWGCPAVSLLRPGKAQTQIVGSCIRA